MIYAQTNYPQTQGINGKYPIHDIGCFLTSFSNLLSNRYGYNITPLDINNRFVTSNLYIDVDDGIRDDIDYGYVTYVDKTVTPVEVYRDRKDAKGNYIRPSVPNSKEVIVKFAYKSPRNGRFSTHFCLYDGDGYIIDSWDGQRKKISDTWYGAPVSYARYAKAVPQAVPPSPVNNAPAYVGKPGIVVLPASVTTWRLYRPGSGLRPNTSDEMAKLAPAKFGGLEYPIEAWVGDYAVLINTQMFGRGVIWVKGTSAQFKDAPAPQPAAPAKAVYKYERLATPIAVRVKPNCNLWNLDYTGGYANAKSLSALSTDPANPTEFIAVGKAIRQDMPDHPTYFMSNESFGDADTTGVPKFNQGVNTVDLGPVPAPTPPPVDPPLPTATHAPDGDVIAVKVLPPNPEAWKASYKINGAGDYIAQASLVIKDLDGKAPDIQLVKGQTVHVAGGFTGPDGIRYWRTVNSANGYTDKDGVKHLPNWRGIPLDSLEEDDSIFTFQDDVIDDFKERVGQISARRKAVIAAARVHGNASWLASRLKKRT